MKKIKELASRSLQRLGWDVRQYNILNSEWLRLVQVLRRHGVTTTLDIGANSGQFARKLRRAGYQGRIISFEPLSYAHAELQRAARLDPAWVIAPPMALGHQEGTVKINVAQNSASSSLLGMTKAHIEAEPGSVYVDEEEIRCARLDQIGPHYLFAEDVIFLKLDVQGFELQVLQGAGRLIDQVACIRTELSLVPLYEGQQLYDEMTKFIQNKGFALWGIEPGFVNSRTGRMLQVDGLFCKSPNADGEKVGFLHDRE